MPTKPQRQNYSSNPLYQDMVVAYQEIDKLLAKVRVIEDKLGIQSNIAPSQGISRALNIPAASDPNAQAQVYGRGFSAAVSNVTLTSGISGLSEGTAPNYNLIISSASSFRGAIGAAAKASITGITLTLAKITGPGTDGSITISAEGIVTAYVAPT